MLIDVSALMQRERSALRLLYELLVLHYPDLPLGEFLPVGSAFAAGTIGCGIGSGAGGEITLTASSAASAARCSSLPPG